jgi:hypothetical protein
MRRARPAAFLLLATAIAACSAISGLDDFTLAGAEDGGGGAAATSSGPPAEDCTDGTDDDGDGLADCADPDCGDHRCAEPAPPGWSGPFWLYEGDPAAAPPCAAPAYVGYADLAPEEAQCSPCTCSGAPMNATCTKGSVGLFSATACSSALGSASLGSPGACVGAGVTNVASALIPATIVAGACGPASPQAPTLPPPAWGRVGLVCAPGSSEVGCPAGGACAPAPGPPFEAALCVVRQGNEGCPGGVYTGKRLFFSDVTDGRSCTSCGCNVQADDCPGTVYGYTDAVCLAQALVDTMTTSHCVNTASHHFKYVPGAPVNAQCAPAGGEPAGCIAPAAPITVCCDGGGGACPAGAIEVTGPAGAPYCVDATEVTKAEYTAFLAGSPSPEDQPPYCAWNLDFVPGDAWPPAGDDQEHPVTYVDWCDASAYCAWAGKRLCGQIGGGSVDMSASTDPAVSQWYNACSAGGQRSFPYGVDHVDGACNDNSNGLNVPMPVAGAPCCMGGSEGIFDMTGNVREWEDSCDKYESSGDKCRARGGSYGSGDQDASCDGSLQTEPRNRRDERIGFRCCSL